MMIKDSISRFFSVVNLSVACVLSAGLLSIYYWRNYGDNPWCTDTIDFYHLLMVSGGGAMCLGVLAGMFLVSVKWYAKGLYILEVFLRYGLAYYLFYYALNQILDIRYPASYSLQGFRLSELEPNQLVYAFFGYTYGYQAFLGWSQLIGGSLLFFRNTAPLGLIIVLAITGNMFMLESSYDLCNATEVSIYVLTAFYSLLPFAKNIVNVALTNRPTQSVENPLFSTKSHGYRALSVLKIIFILGILVFYYNKSSRYLKYYQANTDSPLVGIWKVEEVNYKVQKPNNSAKIFGEFRQFYLEDRRYGAVMVDDSLSYFEYMVDTAYNQLEFWNFYDFKELNLKGKYQMLSPDTILYLGRNGRDTLEMRLSLDKNFRKLR